jgi:hypothetical protein
MKWIIAIAAVLLVAAVIYFAPRCQPGDDAIRIGGVIVAGCK